MNRRTPFSEALFTVVHVSSVAAAHEAFNYELSIFTAIDVGDGAVVVVDAHDRTDNGIVYEAGYGTRVIGIGNGTGVGAGDAAYVRAAGDGTFAAVSSDDGVEDLIEGARVRAGDAAYVVARVLQ